MKLEINGRIVEVDDSFANLPPDQQQKTVESIAAQMSSQPGFVSQMADKLGMSAQDPLLWGGVGTVGGLTLGPMVTEAGRAALQGPAAPGVGTVDPRAPGQKYIAKTGYGAGPGETVREVVDELKARQAPIGKGNISQLITKDKPLTIADYQDLKAREEMEARMRAKNAPLTQKLPPAAQTAVRAAEGAASKFPAWMARGAAGASTGFQAADMINRLREGDVGGGIVSGLGALGSVLSFIPHPITRIGGTALAAGAPLLLSAMEGKGEEKKETGGVNNPMAMGGPVGYARGKAVRMMLPPAENAARTQIPGTLPTYQKAADIFAQRGAMGRGIDYGAGLGKGAQAMPGQYETYEPFARGWSPTYSEASEIPSEAYNRLTNLNVLNVVPREARDEIVKDIGRVMEPGGLGIVTTRGGDVMKATGRPGPEPTSIITSRDTYQKGFTPAELQEYLRYMLGQGYDIERLGLGPAGAMIRKKAEGGDVEEMAGGGQTAKMLQQMYRGFAGAPDKERIFVSPQRRVAEYYADKRAAQTGLQPGLEAVLVDPFAGRKYGHSLPIDKFNREYVTTQARELDPLDVLASQVIERKEGGSTPAWQRKEGKNPEGGLNAAGRASYKRETGGTLKPPVSAEAAKKSPAKAARRKSFCARMSGMPGPMKDEKGRPTRKALSLRKWDC